MRGTRATLLVVIFGFITLPAINAGAEVSPQSLDSISTPDRVDTRIGELRFDDGVPHGETLEKLYDNLDFTMALRAFLDTERGVSIRALDTRLQSVGVKHNEVIVFSK